jgi:hypothetical protein
MRRSFRIALGVLAAGLLLMTAAWLARSVLHGPVNGDSLRFAVVERSGSADALLDSTETPCRQHGPRGTWICVVGDAEGSGSVAYRVVVRPDSSCWRGRLVRDVGEGPMPRRIRGCVHLWQWSLADVLL